MISVKLEIFKVSVLFEPAPAVSLLLIVSKALYFPFVNILSIYLLQLVMHTSRFPSK